MKKTHVVILLLGFLMLIYTTVFSMDLYHDDMFPGYHIISGHLHNPGYIILNNELDLSKEQTLKIREIEYDFKKNTRNLREDIFSKLIDIEDMYTDPS